ncbi:MAG TPA: ELWxxDGT repeat protein [Abditibacteriaceae bacterium]
MKLNKKGCPFVWGVLWILATFVTHASAQDLNVRVDYPRYLHNNKQYVYTVRLRNLAPGDALDTVLSHDIPTGTRFVSARQTSGSQTFTLTTPGVGGTGTIRASRSSMAGSKILTSVEAFTPLNSEVIFKANNGVHGQELWKTGGTRETTALLKDIFRGSNSSSIGLLVAYKGFLFFNATDESGPGLWRTDGTAAGTVRIAPSQSINPGRLTEVNGTLFFMSYASTGSQLWKTDGTSIGTVRVSTRRFSELATVCAANGQFFFVGNDGVTGRELWKSDGTEQGTSLVKDIAPGGQGSGGYYIAPLNSAVYFSAHDGNAFHFYKTDGTEAGTFAFADNSVNHFSRFTVMNGMGFFTAEGALGAKFIGNELWKTDGSTLSLVKDIIPGEGSGMVGDLKKRDKTIFFIGTDTTHGKELWKTDGTTLGTSRTTNLPADVRWLDRVNGTLYFESFEDNRLMLFKTDGTNAGVRPVASLGTIGSQHAAIGTMLYFTKNFDGGCQIWKTDSSGPGAVILHGAGSSDANFEIVVQVEADPLEDRLYGTVMASTSSSELYYENNTAEIYAIIDDTPPAIRIVNPPPGATVAGLSEISVEVDDYGSRAASGSILLRRNSDGLHWNGSRWGTTHQFPLTFGPTESINSSLPSGAEWLPGTYSLSASVVDYAGNQSSVKQSFTISTQPVIFTVESPTDSGAPTLDTRGQVSGRTPVTRIIVYLRRESDGYYWSETAWVKSVSYFTAFHYNNKWEGNESVPVSKLLNGKYSVVAFAYFADGTKARADKRVTVRYGSIVAAQPSNIVLSSVAASNKQILLTFTGAVSPTPTNSDFQVESGGTAIDVARVQHPSAAQIVLDTGGLLKGSRVTIHYDLQDLSGRSLEGQAQTLVR